MCYNIEKYAKKSKWICVDKKRKEQERKFMENYIICNCKQVSYVDIERAVSTHSKMEDVLEVFADVQRITHCSTGCGGCHDKVLDVISEIMMH